jgi:hypothetical protein
VDKARGANYHLSEGICKSFGELVMRRNLLATVMGVVLAASAVAALAQQDAAKPAPPTPEQPADTNPPATSREIPVGRLVDVESDLLECWLNVFLAFVIGTLGSAAFYLAIVTGFIGRTSRAELLAHMALDFRKLEGYIPVLFWCFGGVTAAVFQAAQPSVFVPVQSFVLGMTWWVYVRQTVPPSSLDDLLKKLPPPPQPEPGQPRPTAREAEAEITLPAPAAPPPPPGDA